MFYNKKTKVPQNEKLEVKITDFSKGLNFKEDENILKSNYSVNNYNFVYKVFSLYVIDTTNDYLKINFEEDKKYQEFLEMLVKRSHYKFETDVTSDDKIITLSTCSFEFNDARLVVHGKLIKN